jgi:N-methylhydantoinase A/oxoprolinase/acetone carboxylase beta subunit
MQLDNAYEAFNLKHIAMYEYKMDESIIEMISFKVTAVGQIEHPELAKTIPVKKNEVRHRDVHFEEIGTVPCKIVSRSNMPINELINGPLIIEEDGSTTLVEPGTNIIRNEYDVLIIEVAK